MTQGLGALIKEVGGLSKVKVSWCAFLPSAYRQSDCQYALISFDSYRILQKWAYESDVHIKAYVHKQIQLIWIVDISIINMQESREQGDLL